MENVDGAATTTTAAATTTADCSEVSSIAAIFPGAVDSAIKKEIPSYIQKHYPAAIITCTAATAAFSVIPCGSGCPGSAGPGTSCASVGSSIV